VCQGARSLCVMAVLLSRGVGREKSQRPTQCKRLAREVKGVSGARACLCQKRRAAQRVEERVGGLLRAFFCVCMFCKRVGGQTGVCV
jgi:hypothetical protein